MNETTKQLKKRIDYWMERYGLTDWEWVVKEWPAKKLKGTMLIAKYDIPAMQVTYRVNDAVNAILVRDSAANNTTFNYELELLAHHEVYEVLEAPVRDAEDEDEKQKEIHRVIHRVQRAHSAELLEASL